MKFIKELVPYIIIFVFVMLLRSYVITPVQVVGNSMLNTLHEGEVLILNKYIYHFKKIERFDIVVVKQKKEDALIKRIIGLPGETIEYKDNHLYINGKEIEDPYNDGKTEDYVLETTLGQQEYFVLGDNRSDSLDSRILGPIKQTEIKGRIDLRIWPLNKLGTIK